MPTVDWLLMIGEVVIGVLSSDSMMNGKWELHSSTIIRSYPKSEFPDLLSVITSAKTLLPEDCRKYVIVYRRENGQIKNKVPTEL